MRLFATIRYTRSYLFSACGAIFLAAIAQPALAQSDAESSGEQENAPVGAIDTVTVTGSRLQQTDGTRAPTPLTVISSDEISAAAKTNLADYVNTLPQLQNSSNPRTAGFSSSADNQGSNRLNLRNLGSERTLVLLDGRRVVPSVSDGAVDLNMIPNALIKRVEIVTGGASAAYGADAVAGVVNLILDTDFTGLKANIQGGSSSESDAESWSGSLTGGKSFADDRGHFVATVDYANSKAASLGDRDWARGWGFIPNPAFAPGNGESERIPATIGSGLATPGGLFIPPPLRGTQFDDNGNPIPFDFGPNSGSSFNSAGPDAYDVIPLQQAASNVERTTGFARVSYDINDSLNVYGELLYAKSTNEQETLPLFRFVNVLVRADNAYLDPVTAQRFTDLGIPAFPMSKFALNLGVLEPSNSRELQRYVIGIDGDLGDNWSWGAYYQYGEVDTEIKIDNNAVTSRFNLASDAVLDGNGGIACRSTLTDPGNGCLPYNVFGNQPVSPATKDYIVGTIVQNQLFKQHVWSVNVTGSPVELWAGPLMVAAGADYRRESSSADADQRSLDNDWFVGNYKPFSGKVDVKELFVELGLPLLTDSSIGNLDFNGAIRSTDYSNSGNVTTWKGGLVYSPTEELRFRLTSSHDIRAPNTNNLFSGGRFNTTSVNDPFNGGASDGTLQNRTGNPDLQPEEADTLTVGAVYEPEWLPGLSLSLDYFDIELEDEIGGISIQNIIDNCFAGQTEFCDFVIRDNTGDITEIRNVPFNIAESRVSGWDLEVNYSMELGPGSLRLRTFAAYVDKLSRGAPGTASFISRRGEVGNNAGAAGAGSPEWQGVGNIVYQTDGGTNYGATVRYVGSAKIESDLSSLQLAGNDVSSRTYLDLNASHTFDTASGSYQVYGAVDNVFDRDPPIIPSLQGTAAFDTPTNAAIYDTLGRMIRVGVRVNF